MNFLDRAIAAISPKAGAERMRYRALMSASAHFDAAGRGKRAAGYKAPMGDGNASARGGRRLRLIARDMVRNNALARRAVSALVDNIVGDGIIPSIEADSDADERRLQERMLEHTDTTAIDAAGRTNLYGVQRMAVEGMVVGGEMLLRNRLRRLSDQVARLPFQVELLEPEYLDDKHLGRLQNGNDEYEGIEFDALRRRVRYRLYQEHPEDILTGFPSSRPVAASAVAHLYRVDRPGQRRGVTWLAPVIPLMDDAFSYADAQLVRQKIAAMWVGFIRDADGDGLTDETETKQFSLTPGMFENLPPRKDVIFAEPPAVEGYAEHMSTVHRMIAAALGMTYEELSGDLSGVNFSSARIGRIAMRRAVEAAQWTVVIPAMCEPMERWLKQGLELQPDMPRVDYRIKWTPPRFPMTDPAREIPAMLDEIRGGLSSRQRKIRELGFDPEEINREIEEDRAAEAAIGVTFEGSPTAPADFGE